MSSGAVTVLPSPPLLSSELGTVTALRAVPVTLSPRAPVTPSDRKPRLRGVKSPAEAAQRESSPAGAHGHLHAGASGAQALGHHVGVPVTHHGSAPPPVSAPTCFAQESGHSPKLHASLPQAHEPTSLALRVLLPGPPPAVVQKHSTCKDPTQALPGESL